MAREPKHGRAFANCYAKRRLGRYLTRLLPCLLGPSSTPSKDEAEKTGHLYVARRGEAFVTGLQSTNQLQLKWNGQQCKFEVTLSPETPNEISRVGPLLCKGVSR